VVKYAKKVCSYWVHPLLKNGEGDFPMLPYNRPLKTKARSLRTKPTDAELHLWHACGENKSSLCSSIGKNPLQTTSLIFMHRRQTLIERDGAQHLEPGQSKYDA
jgi:very-short-patch-repair endonuclease